MQLLGQESCCDRFSVNPAHSDKENDITAQFMHKISLDQQIKEAQKESKRAPLREINLSQVSFKPLNDPNAKPPQLNSQ